LVIFIEKILYFLRRISHKHSITRRILIHKSAPGLTKLPGRSGKCPLHSSTVGIISSTDTTFILNLVGTDFFITAHFLGKEDIKCS
jgi:hypothetical protein